MRIVHCLLVFVLGGVSAVCGTTAVGVAGSGAAESGSGAPETPADWLTPAEVAQFGATPSYAETIAFLRRIEAASPAVKLDFFGESASGRPLPLVVVSTAGAFTAESARARNQPILLVINGIHAGEIDGKDATLLLLRELALGRLPVSVEGMTILFVPIYNVDGHERVSPWNRPNQDGPAAGMGFRTTTDGHDLNRDFVKLETPEARSLVALYNAWQPHLVIDNHVTDGVDLEWVLTWAVPTAPQLPGPVDQWMQAAMPRMLFELELAGHPTGPYVSLVDPLDPMKGFDSFAAEPRFSTGYFPLRNRPVLLVETHSHKPYRDRVLATRDLMLAAIRELGAHGVELRSAIGGAALATVGRGQGTAPPSEITVTWESDAPGDARVPFVAWSQQPSVVSGQPMTVWDGDRVREELVPWYFRLRPAKQLSRPRGYLLEPGWPAIESRIVAHGLRFVRLERELEAEVETTRFDAPRFAASTYQGRTRVEATPARARERRSLPAGSLWIPADQPDFELAVQLLEPEAPDSVFSWGLVSSIFEGKEYIDLPKLDRLARQQLEDPAARAEWERALTDPLFAADLTARYRWWYRRTPYWDERIGLYPVYRVMERLPALR
ncbi:MAG: M14 family metallopeptidase [Thermoanaerobaculia bacterium]